ncbi:MAG: ABC transporter permease [Actinomycetota bacterium]|nr:ABC transporter permease [Actinomycetota bacterium]
MAKDMKRGATDMPPVGAISDEQVEDVLTPDQQTMAGTATAISTSAGVPASTAAGAEVALTLWGDVWRRLRKNRLAIIGLGIVGVLLITAVFAPLIAPYDTNDQRIDVASRCSGPCAPTLKHWMGTDQLGRDQFSRIVYGARVSVIVGVFAVGIALALGLALGALSGYFGGAIDALVMRIADVFFAFPYVLAAIVLIIAIGQGVGSIVVAIGIFAWATIARLLRASILSTKETEYVEAARALGANHWRIITRHVMPNSMAPVIVYATILIGSAILTEAALSFLGIGVVPPTPAWGYMVNAGKPFLTTRPYMIIFPGIAIVFTVLGFIFLGDGLRDSMDPRLR